MIHEETGRRKPESREDDEEVDDIINVVTPTKTIVYTQDDSFSAVDRCQ
jgi:hypothetical protein